jgi:hypothetical protein
MHLLGVDTDSLKPQFDSAVPNRVLLLDGDGPCYQVTNTAKTLDTAIRQYVKKVMEYMFMVNCSTVRIHLTAKRSVKAHRAWYPTVKPYQGNRAGKPKPPLLEALRSAIAHRHSMEDGSIPLDWSVFLHDYWEADDGLVQDSLFYADNGVIWSEDKDLRLSRGPYYELSTGRIDYIDNAYGHISEAFTEGGSLKVKGHGTKFFWCQMLMGDSADHVKGIQRLNGKLCGEAGALEFLQPIGSEDEAANQILWAYAKAKQQFLPEAEVLWLRRHAHDSAYQYIKSLDLDKNLRNWLEQSHQMHEEIFAIKSEEAQYASEDC